MTTNIGNQLKALRKERNITLAELAKAAGLSLGYLSKLEHDQTSPTLINLHRICDALNITLNDILDEKGDSPNVLIVRAQDRKLLFEQDDGEISYTSVTTGNTLIKVSAMSIDSDQVYQSTPHSHDELGIVVAGSIEMMVEQKRYLLNVGDSIYIRAGSEHNIRRAEPGPCVSYWIKVAGSVDKHLLEKASPIEAPEAVRN